MTVGPTALHRCKAQIVEARKRLSSSANWDNWGDGETSRIEIWLSSMDVDGKSWEIPRIKDRLGVNFSCTRVLKILLGDKQHPSDVPVDWMFWCFFFPVPSSMSYFPNTFSPGNGTMMDNFHKQLGNLRPAIAHQQLGVRTFFHWPGSSINS